MTTTDPVPVYWYECDCDWLTKYCDEHHRRTALVPREVLEQLSPVSRVVEESP